MKTRRQEVHRVTSETDIAVTLTLDGAGAAEVSTGIGFLDHMLELFAYHGGFDLVVAANGDLDVDGHHTVEAVSYTHLRAHETRHDLVCRLLLEKKKKK